jgi:threonine aldolase
MDPIDLRSDTVTRPVPGMRTAMADAEVGDDVYGEDVTVNRLEERAAAMLGKQAALFVPSGTMANQIAIRSLTRPGDVLAAGQGAHVLRYESGAAAALWGVQIQTLGRDGLFEERDLEAAIPPDDVHLAPLTAISIENTHNVSGGRVWPVEQLESVSQAARDRGIGVHLDGARLFNASRASGVDVERIAATADTVAFCLSKGLGAPVGSMVCCDGDRMPELRRVRKMLGGGMRQAGILAAAGLYALEHHVERLQEDHDNALALARGLAAAGLDLPREPETNLVYFGVPEGRFARVPDAPTFARAARSRDLLIDPVDRRQLRAVTHLDAPAQRVEEALARVRDLLS